MFTSLLMNIRVVQSQYLQSLCLLLTIFFSGCTSRKEIAIDYFSQTPPGSTARIFAASLITTNKNEHSPLTFSPDGTLLLWATMDSNYRGAFWEMKFENGSWSKPATPSFADTISAYFCPAFSVDGKTLYFSSRRNAPGYREGRGNRIWSVTRNAEGWSTPVPLDSTVSKAEEFSHSVAKSGTIYFSSPLDSANTSLNICKAVKTNSGYSKPEMLPFGINSIGYEDGPYISPDEDYLIFESTRPEGIEGSHDLYIVFKDGDGNWKAPVNMGPKINSSSMERFPRVSPDGKYLFFASNRDQSQGRVGFDYYWIDANVIDELRK
jgi:hypothetical protein